MSEHYQLVTDASADLIRAFSEKEKIHIIPMTYMIGEREYISDGFVSPDTLKQFYQAERENQLTRTSQISPQAYLDCFRSYAEKGESVLYLSLSSGLSGTYNTACFAAEEIMGQFPEITIRCVDSRSATVGIQLLLEKAAENRRNGMTLEENALWLEKNRLNVCHWFLVDDLHYLKLNGRISSATALIGGALNIKPILRIENDGSLVNFVKKRGSRVALNQLLDFYFQSSDQAPGSRVMIVHADYAEGADYLEDAVREHCPNCNITRSILSPVIGCHTGPGLCAIAHWGRRNP